MTVVQRITLLCGIGIGLVSSSGAQAAKKSEKSSPKQESEIRFTVKLESNQGQLACAIFQKWQWLEKTDHPAYAKIEGRQATCVFRGVKPGTYAISAFQDENRNKELDTNFMGIPTESWCTSRNASGFMGPPKFDDAKFKYGGGKLELRATM